MAEITGEFLCGDHGAAGIDDVEFDISGEVGGKGGAPTRVAASGDGAREGNGV